MKGLSRFISSELRSSSYFFGGSIPDAMLANWLAHAVSQFRAGPTTEGPTAAILSIGNDAGDLDSLVSSIAIASFQPGSNSADPPLWLPLAPFARADFRLRQDACLLFKHLGFEFDGTGAPTALLHLDEVKEDVVALWQNAPVVPSGTAPAAGHLGGGIGVALVDHNACSPEVSSLLGQRVVAIVDHHNDEEKHLASLPAAGADGECDALACMLDGVPLRTIEPAVGSTCSLLAELMDTHASPKGTSATAGPAPCPAPPPPYASGGVLGAGGGLSAHYSDELCVLLLAAITIDTRGFDPKLLGVKFAAADVRAAQRLLAALGAPVPTRLPPAGSAGGEAFELVLQASVALRDVPLPGERRISLSQLDGKGEAHIWHSAHRDPTATNTLSVQCGPQPH